MYKFDVKYKFENYLEYYKYALIKSKMWRDILFAVMFIAIGIYWIVSKQKTTYVAYFCFAFGIIIPLWSFVSFPLIKKQLRNNLPVIERTHLIVTFNDEEIVYENLSLDAKPTTDDNKEEVKETAVAEENIVEEKVEEKLETIDANEETSTEEKTEPKEETKEQTNEERVFKLKYNNFQLVREIDGLIVFYLDRQTIIILPKETLVENGNIDEFKSFILTKMPTNRVKFSKK